MHAVIVWPTKACRQGYSRMSAAMKRYDASARSSMAHGRSMPAFVLHAARCSVFQNDNRYHRLHFGISAAHYIGQIDRYESLRHDHPPFLIFARMADAKLSVSYGISRIAVGTVSIGNRASYYISRLFHASTDISLRIVICRSCHRDQGFSRSLALPSYLTSASQEGSRGFSRQIYHGIILGHRPSIAALADIAMISYIKDEKSLHKLRMLGLPHFHGILDFRDHDFHFTASPYRVDGFKCSINNLHFYIMGGSCFSYAMTCEMSCRWKFQVMTMVSRYYSNHLRRIAY